MSKASLLEQLEKCGSEQEVRTRLAQGKYHTELVPQVIEWLRRKEEARTSAAAFRSEARDEESLSISRKALRNSEEANSIARKALKISESANWIAKSAIILSIIMAMYEIIKWYSK